MKTAWVVWALLSVVVAGCAGTSGTAAQSNAQPAGSPATVDWAQQQRAECEARGGGVWIAGPGQCARGGGGM